MVGTQVSHYRIVAKIGAGGMGEVFLAEDTRLDRKAAIRQKLIGGSVGLADPFRRLPLDGLRWYDRIVRLGLWRWADGHRDIGHSCVCAQRDVHRASRRDRQSRGD